MKFKWELFMNGKAKWALLMFFLSTLSGMNFLYLLEAWQTGNNLVLFLTILLWIAFTIIIYLVSRRNPKSNKP